MYCVSRGVSRETLQQSYTAGEVERRTCGLREEREKGTRARSIVDRRSASSGRQWATCKVVKWTDSFELLLLFKWVSWRLTLKLERSVCPTSGDLQGAVFFCKCVWQVETAWQVASHSGATDQRRRRARDVMAVSGLFVLADGYFSSTA